jgi:predicted DNA-binding protein
MENTLKRDNYVRLRINSIEKERLLNIEKLTGRKRSDIVREAIYRFIKGDYPEFI